METSAGPVSIFRGNKEDSKALIKQFYEILETLNLTRLEEPLKQALSSYSKAEVDMPLKLLTRDTPASIQPNDLTRFLYVLSQVCFKDIFCTQEKLDKLNDFRTDMHYAGFNVLVYPHAIENFFSFEHNYSIMFVLQNYNKFKRLL